MQKSWWIGAIDATTKVFTDKATGLTFRHISGDTTGAKVSICRYGGEEDLDSCCANRDNDCDGLVS